MYPLRFPRLSSPTSENCKSSVKPSDEHSIRKSRANERNGSLLRSSRNCIDRACQGRFATLFAIVVLFVQSGCLSPEPRGRVVYDVTVATAFDHGYALNELRTVDPSADVMERYVDGLKAREAFTLDKLADCPRQRSRRPVYARRNTITFNIDPEADNCNSLREDLYRSRDLRRRVVRYR